MSERWKLGWLESYNAYTGEPERFVYRPGDDEHTRICVMGENCDEDARRIVASVNACQGIPTETLEDGVVVVPMEAITAAADEAWENAWDVLEQYRDEDGNEMDDAPGLREVFVQEFTAAISRLQQNGEVDKR